MPLIPLQAREILAPADRQRINVDICRMLADDAAIAFLVLFSRSASNCQS
jgi:hypothetical protein